MKTRTVDPRYITWTDEEPTYRVDFWEGAHSSEEWLVEEATDVTEVQQWARAEAQGRDIVIYVQTQDDDQEKGLVRLLGREPN